MAKPSASITKARNALMQADPVLGKHIGKVGAYALVVDERASLYEALAESIVYQQLTGKAAATIFGRLKALTKDRVPTPKEIARMEEATLRGVGLSGAKTRALQDLAAKTSEGLIPSLDEAHRLTDDELVDRITQVRGIGPWTVHMLMMFRLGRTDILPTTDYGVRKGFQVVFRKRALPTPAQVEERGEKWRPHRTMASWYLWRALDTPAARS